MNGLKDFWRVPSPLVMAQRELEEAQRRLLEAASAKEYADAMCTYHAQRIERLRAFLAKEGGQNA